MAREPLALFEDLLRAAPDAGSPEEAVTWLRRQLRADPDAWPEGLRRTMDGAGVGTGYVLRHLLSIARFAPDVVDALRRGLPLRVARLVNGIEDDAARTEVLAPLREALGVAGGGPGSAAGGALLPRGLSAAVERAARRWLAAQAAPVGRAEATASGWLAGDASPPQPRRPRGDVWIYPPQSRASVHAEILPGLVVEALVATYLPHGGRLVDVTAGAGTIALAARHFGVSTWSSDLAPAAPFVQGADARALFGGTGPNPGRGAADAVVVHPPTYPTWRDALPRSQRSTATVEAYADEVGAMVAGALPALAAGGAAIVISRPVRSEGLVSLTVSHLAVVLQDLGLRVAGYHVAAARDGTGDWHVVVGRKGAG